MKAMQFYKACAACGKKATTERLGRNYCKKCAKAGDERLMRKLFK